MNRTGLLIAGVALILIGLLGMVGMLGFPFFGFSLVGWGISLAWPGVVVLVGLLFLAPPFLWRQRGLGALFIPGFPILATGLILSFTNLTGWWGAWSWLWPAELLAVAAGFFSAALFMRQGALIVPGIFMGVNWAVFQFCAVTGWWSSWAWLWTAEPFALGLALLVWGLIRRSAGLKTAGLILVLFAGIGFFGMGLILAGAWWLGGLLGPAMLILLGFVLLGWSLVARRPVRMEG